MSPEPIHLDPAAVLERYQARVRQQMAAAAQREADLLEEIANLEAYAAHLLSSAAPPGADPWGTTDPANTKEGTTP